jgi:hypothetical protein
MITSFMGTSPLHVIAVLDGVWVRVRRESDGAIREWRIADLREDTPGELREAMLKAVVRTHVP